MVFWKISQNSQENTCARICNSGLRPKTLFKKKTLVHVFSCEFCEILKNTFLQNISWPVLLSSSQFEVNITQVNTTLVNSIIHVTPFNLKLSFSKCSLFCYFCCVFVCNKKWYLFFYQLTGNIIKIEQKMLLFLVNSMSFKMFSNTLTKGSCTWIKTLDPISFSEKKEAKLDLNKGALLF